MHITAQGCRLRNDLYCVEWDLNSTIPYHTWKVMENTPQKKNLENHLRCSVRSLYWINYMFDPQYSLLMLFGLVFGRIISLRMLMSGTGTSKFRPCKPCVSTLECTFYWQSLIFPSVLWHCWLGDGKGIRPVKSWMLVVGDDDLTGTLHDLNIQLSSPLPSSFASINTSYPGLPG